MTKPVLRLTSSLLKFLCLQTCLQFCISKVHFKASQNTKIYILVEHCEAWGGVPLDMNDVFHGVFLSKEAAEKHLWHIARYEYGLDTSKLSLVDGRAKDAENHTYFEIIRGYIQ